MLVRSLVLLGVLVVASPASAASKDECLDAHGRGQDARAKGQLVRARQLFLTCAQSSCPTLVQGDCARFAEEVDRLTPTVGFVARDARSIDLPATSVYVDDALVATRLDDGKMYELDPGKHVVRFVNDGRETTMKVVLNQGEKGRIVSATFANIGAPPPPHVHEAPPPPAPARSPWPIVAAGTGGAALAAGAILAIIGVARVPSSCSIAAHDCAAPPGDPAFSDARSGVTLTNIGIGIGIGGAVLMVTGLVLYMTSKPTAPVTTGRIAPWLTENGIALQF
jgi:hypothetical protein